MTQKHNIFFSVRYNNEFLAHCVFFKILFSWLFSLSLSLPVLITFICGQNFIRLFVQMTGCLWSVDFCSKRHTHTYRRRYTRAWQPGIKQMIYSAFGYQTNTNVLWIRSASGQPANAAAYAPGRRRVCTHQMATLFCVK